MHTRPPILPFRSVGQALSLRSNRSLSQSSTSSSTHPTRFGPRFTRLGNAPTFSSLAMCCGEYRTSSRSWRFDSILITISPRMKSIAMPRLRQAPRKLFNFVGWVKPTPILYWLAPNMRLPRGFHPPYAC